MAIEYATQRAMQMDELNMCVLIVILCVSYGQMGATMMIIDSSYIPFHFVSFVCSFRFSRLPFVRCFCNFVPKILLYFCFFNLRNEMPSS